MRPDDVFAVRRGKILHADRLGDLAVERDGLFWTERRQNQADRNGAASFGAAACPRMRYFDPTRAHRARIE